MKAHGFANITWQSLALPARFWDNVERVGEHWLPTKAGVTREYVVTRLLQCRWGDVYAATPTCGEMRCINPSHVCVTMKPEAEEQT